MREIKPKAYSMGNCGYEIVYTCGNDGCDFTFTMATDDWHYCPKCGTKIDWGVIIQANAEWKQQFLAVQCDKEKRKELLDNLNEHNKTIADGCRYDMKKTEATKNAITNSNISYYLGVGWTTEKLVEKGLFTKELIDKYLETRR